MDRIDLGAAGGNRPPSERSGRRPTPCPAFPMRGGARRGWTRLAARVTVIGAVMTAAAIGPTLPAHAHHGLIASDPGDGATVNVPPTSVSLTFDQPVDAADVLRPLVVVTGPDGRQYQSGTSTADGVVITTAVEPFHLAGEYSVVYRVISAQGAVGGVVHFTVLHPAVRSGTASPRPLVTQPAELASSDDTDPGSGGLPWWIWTILAAAIVAAGTIIIRDMTGASAPRPPIMAEDDQPPA